MSPSEKFKKPVIGTITAQISGKVTLDGVTRRTTLPEDTFEVIDIVCQGDQKTYICNQWNSPGVVQVVPGFFVKKFISK